MVNDDGKPDELNSASGPDAGRAFVADATFLPDAAGLLLELELLSISDAEGLAETWQTLQGAEVGVAIGSIRSSSTKVKGRYRLRVDLQFRPVQRPALP